MKIKKHFIPGMLIVALFLFVIVMSCEKEDDEPTPPVENGDNGNDNDDNDNNGNNGEDFACGGEFTDTRDGTVYSTVQIGDQCWMAENLRYLPSVVGPGASAVLTNYYYVYEYYGTSVTDAKTSINYNAYGVLYNWSAAMNACPEGWYLPNNVEWTKLVDYVVAQGYPNEGGNPDGAGNALKSCRQVDSPLGGECDTSEHPRWNSCNIHYGADVFGFTALPGGNVFGSFESIGNCCYFWSATEYDTYIAWVILCSCIGNVNKTNLYKKYGFSVRCIKGN